MAFPYHDTILIRDGSWNVLTVLHDLNHHFVRSVAEADVQWFDRHLSRDFYNTNPDGTLIGKVKVPEGVANVCFGGPKRNRNHGGGGNSGHRHEGAPVRSGGGGNGGGENKGGGGNARPAFKGPRRDGGNAGAGGARTGVWSNR